MRCKVIYKITNNINRKVYIGQSNQPRGRWNKHKSSAKRCPTQIIHIAMNKYGVNNFTFEIIASVIPILDENEYCKVTDELERYFIQEYKSFGQGYNVSPGGDTTPKTKEWKAKILPKLFAGKQQYIVDHGSWNKGLVGVMPDPWNKGKPMSEDTKRKLSKSCMGRQVWNKGSSTLGKGVSDKQSQDICARYKNGETLMSIHNATGHSIKTIVKLLRDNDVAIRSRGTTPRPPLPTHTTRHE